MNRTSIPFGLKGAKMVSVEEVPRGLKCGCVCPECGGKLVARRCHKKVDHFAHYSLTDCKSALETSLHKMAKQILSTAPIFKIPEVTVTHPRSGKPHSVRDALEIPLDEVQVEKRLTDIQPDLIVTSGGRKLYIEIYVSHKVGTEKLDKIKEHGNACLEIDCRNWRDYTDIEDFTRFLLYGTEQKTWLYNQFADKALEKLKRQEQSRLGWIREMQSIAENRESNLSNPIQMREKAETIQLNDPRVQQYAIFPKERPKLSKKQQHMILGIEPAPCRSCGRPSTKWSQLDTKSWTCLCREC